MLNSESSPVLKQLPPKSLVNRFQVKRTKRNVGAAQINNSTHLQQYALNEATQNDDRFNALSAKLNKFKKTHKKKTRQTSHQFDWKREFVELKESQRKAEQVRARVGRSEATRPYNVSPVVICTVLCLIRFVARCHPYHAPHPPNSTPNTGRDFMSLVSSRGYGRGGRR